MLNLDFSERATNQFRVLKKTFRDRWQSCWEANSFSFIAPLSVSPAVTVLNTGGKWDAIYKHGVLISKRSKWISGKKKVSSETMKQTPRKTHTFFPSDHKVGFEWFVQWRSSCAVLVVLQCSVSDHCLMCNRKLRKFHTQLKGQTPQRRGSPSIYFGQPQHWPCFGFGFRR